ncbi:class I SAM-dependent methyltransferase [Paenibacillus protaetiae]|uniref:SAM-dependent methyltransferase n=1 Tax=Paenibacillus protaetiae TaxID=2509456 RepID=A0A4P6EWF5_9BACL|nr:class I SAM-dependent methyltransferase [Paenibacillus protaetiae]QAY66059.1 SAM-dependent methyltransferase [Paenibacillus protaetiae]
MIVTTTDRPKPEMYAKAQLLSKELDIPFVPRRNRTLGKLAEQQRDERLLVVTDRELRYYYAGPQAPPLYFHPSMAYVRVKRLRAGEKDPLITISRCESGDKVLDCTAGLAADSLVFSYAVGTEGAVTALESEEALYVVVRDGLASYESSLPDVDEAMRRIRMVNTGHLSYLCSLPDNSVDIVYFDPMFREPIHESSALQPLRGLANVGALAEEAVAEAKRVARKTVVMKEHRDSGEFERLGFEKKHANTSKIAYGVIDVDSNK